MTAGAIVNSIGRMDNDWIQVTQSGQQENQTMKITKNIVCYWKELNGRTGIARKRKGSLVRRNLEIPKVCMSCTLTN